VAAVEADDYVRGEADYTATELIQPSRLYALKAHYWEDLVEDASDRVWALSGQARHTVLEKIAKSNPDRFIVEQRFTAEIPDNENKRQN
jgi:hypothetical protein